MDEPVNSGSDNAQPPKKEMSMEVRLLLAFLLMGAVMFLTPYFYKSAAPPAPVKKAAQTSPSTPPPAATTAAPAPVEAAAAPAAKAARGKNPADPKLPSGTVQQPEPAFVVDTSLFRVVFSNQGANVRSWQLKKFKGNDGKPLELMNPAAGLQYPFSLYFANQKPATNINWAYFTQKGDPDGLGVTFEFSDGHVAAKKVFRFKKDSYISEVTTQVTVDGKPLPHQIEWRGGFGDHTIPTPANAQRTLHYNLTDAKLVEENAKAAKNGPVSASGNFSFAGMADTYFAAVFLPEGSDQVQVTTFSDSAPTPLDKTPQPFAGSAVSDGPANRFRLFVGPKDVDMLKVIDPHLEQVVDFGWLAFLAKPLFLIVNWFNDSFVHNYGWSIILVTIVINFVLFPLKMANMKSMRKMQALAPQISAINDKYKNVGLRDPKKADQNQEVMALYKVHGVNPMGGCVPMLLQIPFFFAFYKVFTVSVEMRGASWLWVTDLSQPEHLAIKVLPIVMIASQFLMQKMTPQPNSDPSQQKMMMMMPLVFGFMFYNFASGLVLYYLTSNLVGMGQQWFYNHTAAAEEAARSVQPKKKIVRK